VGARPGDEQGGAGKWASRGDDVVRGAARTPLTVGALADATSLSAALWVVPVFLALAAVGLFVVRRTRT
jgi:hypothetical protein